MLEYASAKYRNYRDNDSLGFDLSSLGIHSVFYGSLEIGLLLQDRPLCMFVPTRFAPPMVWHTYTVFHSSRPFPTV